MNTALLKNLSFERTWHKFLTGVLANIVGTITEVSTEIPVCSLTFDDGPHPEFTPQLLDIFERYQARATFFMLGENAERFPELVKRIAKNGHAIGNHSWDHPSFPLIAGRERRAQIRACAKAIAPYGKRLFRPPFGHQSVLSRLDALLLGYQVVTWNIVAHDWLDHEPKWMVSLILNRIQPGSIILFHDALHDTLDEQFANRDAMLRAINLLLEKLSDRYRFVTLPELFKHGRPKRSNWYDKADLDFLNQLTVREGKARRYA